MVLRWSSRDFIFSHWNNNVFIWVVLGDGALVVYYAHLTMMTHIFIHKVNTGKIVEFAHNDSWFQMFNSTKGSHKNPDKRTIF